ncbi:MAG: MFS transporter [Gemmatales bacterium]|nr:MAG: MFS transporter [Gemmatales bacterium]
MDVTVASDSPSCTARLSRAGALWALLIIVLANFFNYLDRQLVSAVEHDLTSDLGLTSGQYGLLWSLFTVGYLLCAVPIGYLADRASRTRLFAFCVFVWSIATVASGWAETKSVLYVARLLIGVGEAGCLVIGPSLISDYFSVGVRGRALSLFYLGLPLGGTAAFILAGLWLGESPPPGRWRTLFYLAGFPGFLIALLIWLLPEPSRGQSAGAPGHESGRFRDYLPLLKTRTLLLIIVAQACAVFFLVPLIHFGVKFFEQSRGMRPDQARIALGLIALVAGGLGTAASGIIGDLLARRYRGAYSLMAAIGYWASWPCLLIGFHSKEPAIFLPAVTLGAFFIFMCMPAVNTQIANVTRSDQRSKAWALAVFILHFLGDMVSPPLFGVLEGHMSRQAVFTMFSSSLILAGLCSFLAIFSARRDELGTLALDSASKDT